MGEKTYTGGCHCGAVRYEARVDLDKPASRCNCSLCTKLGGVANILIKPHAFKLLSGEESLTDYGREGNPTHHPFCRVCGVHVFGRGDIPEIGGPYIAIHAGSIDDVDLARLKYIYWDGRHDNWSAGPRAEPWPVART